MPRAAAAYHVSGSLSLSVGKQSFIIRDLNAAVANNSFCKRCIVGGQVCKSFCAVSFIHPLGLHVTWKGNVWTHDCPHSNDDTLPHLAIWQSCMSTKRTRSEKVLKG